MVRYDIALPNHVIIDMYGVDFGPANDLDGIRALSRRIIAQLRSDLIGEVYKKLEPQGVIYVALLLQSHVSVHTWPEVGHVAVDVYTCGTVPVTEIVDEVLSFFKPKKRIVRFIERPVLEPQEECPSGA